MILHVFFSEDKIHRSTVTCGWFKYDAERRAMAEWSEKGKTRMRVYLLLWNMSQNNIR